MSDTQNLSDIGKFYLSLILLEKGENYVLDSSNYTFNDVEALKGYTTFVNCQKI